MTLAQLMDQHDIDKSRIDEKYADLVALHVEEALKPYVSELTCVRFDKYGELTMNGDSWYEFDPRGPALSRHGYELGSALCVQDRGILRYLANRTIFPKEQP